MLLARLRKFEYKVSFMQRPVRIFCRIYKGCPYELRALVRAAKPAIGSLEC